MKGLTMANILTVYFSIKGQTLGAGMTIVMQEKGNTEIAAEYIQQAVGGDLFEIEADRDYSPDHMVLIEQAKKELEDGIRVPVKSFPENLESYDAIFLGYPNWWNTIPMVLFTFLEQSECAGDLAGKRIVPFCTNEGSGLGDSVQDIKAICKDALVDSGIALIGHRVKDSREKIAGWAKGVLQGAGLHPLGPP